MTGESRAISRISINFWTLIEKPSTISSSPANLWAVMLGPWKSTKKEGEEGGVSLYRDQLGRFSNESTLLKIFCRGISPTHIDIIPTQEICGDINMCAGSFSRTLKVCQKTCL